MLCKLRGNNGVHRNAPGTQVVTACALSEHWGEGEDSIEVLVRDGLHLFLSGESLDPAQGRLEVGSEASILGNMSRRLVLKLVR